MSHVIVIALPQTRTFKQQLTVTEIDLALVTQKVADMVENYFFLMVGAVIHQNLIE